MFTQNMQREIPSTLDDCTRSHPTVETLHFWAKRLSVFGDILCAIMMLAGAVLTINSTIKLIDLDRNSAFMTFFSTCIAWVINTIIVFCLFRTAVLIIGAIATITQYTVINANVALLEANQKTDTSTGLHQETNTFPDPWQCEHCGEINKPYNSQCKNCEKSR